MTTFPEIHIEKFSRFEDDRGHMARLWDFADQDFRVAQISQSRTAHSGVLRGISVSFPPHREAKIIACTAGLMQWIVLDLRISSPTIGRWMEILLTPGTSVFVPAGFGHGCLALEAPVDLILAADQPYNPAHFAGIRWDDSNVAIGWRLQETGQPLVSSAHEALSSYQTVLEKLKSSHGDCS